MTYLPDAKVRWIVIHYSATPVEGNYTVSDIDAMHRRRGFKEIGYHVFIRQSGLVQYGRDLTQPGRFEQGAHSQGENDASVGICFEGGVTAKDPDFGFDTRTDAQRKAMIGEIDKLLARFGGDGIDPAKGPVVTGHRDMPGAATQCPGFDAGAWWRAVQADRRAKLLKSTKLPGWLTAILKWLTGGRA